LTSRWLRCLPPTFFSRSHLAHANCFSSIFAKTNLASIVNNCDLEDLGVIKPRDHSREKSANVLIHEQATRQTKRCSEPPSHARTPQKRLHSLNSTPGEPHSIVMQQQPPTSSNNLLLTSCSVAFSVSLLPFRSDTPSTFNLQLLTTGSDVPKHVSEECLSTVWVTQVITYLRRCSVRLRRTDGQEDAHFVDAHSTRRHVTDFGR